LLLTHVEALLDCQALDATEVMVKGAITVVILPATTADGPPALVALTSARSTSIIIVVVSVAAAATAMPVAVITMTIAVITMTIAVTTTPVTVIVAVTTTSIATTVASITTVTAIAAMSTVATDSQGAHIAGQPVRDSLGKESSKEREEECFGVNHYEREIEK